ncbi:MAG: serine acetyltransferase [Armatimonadetes bacterium]|jgi:serine O-acetyltransferase|nr:serine acetyltransferase [Armatimonadota bacterium]
MFDNFKADIDRYVAYSGQSKLKLLLLTQGLWATAEYRYNRWVHLKVRIPVVRQLMKLFGLFWHKWIQMCTGIDLPCSTDIGKGLYIGHFGGIIIGDGVKIGEKCNISQGITIGFAGRGDRWGSPTIGNGVQIYTGAVIVGKITVGDNAVIGANAVVTKDVPESAVVGGVPAKILSYDGASDFINYDVRKKVSDNE